MEKHFVQFFSPGSFMSERTDREIDSWDVDKAVELARSIVERHSAKPYGFRFVTRSRGDNDLDSSITRAGIFYHLGGNVLTLQDIIDRNDPSDRILISNMRNNNIERVVENTNSWKHITQLNDGDVVLDVVL